MRRDQPTAALAQGSSELPSGEEGGEAEALPARVTGAALKRAGRAGGAGPEGI